MDMKEQTPTPGTVQPTSLDNLTTPQVLEPRHGRREFFGSIRGRLNGEINSAPVDAAHLGSEPQSREEVQNPISRVNRRLFTKVAGAVAALFATNPKKAFAQLGGVGPEGARPPDVSDPNTPLPDNRAPEARVEREGYMQEIDFLPKYKGKDTDLEKAAMDTFRTLYGIASEVSRAIPALKALNGYMDKDNPNKNGYHIVGGLGPNNQYGEVSVGVVAFNPNVDMGIKGINPNLPLSVLRKVEIDERIGLLGKKIDLVHLVIIGVPRPEIMVSDNFGLVVEGVLYPYNKMIADRRFLEEAIAQMISNGGAVDIEKLKEEMTNPKSVLNTNARIEAWISTLDPIDDMLSSGVWRVDPDFKKFHEGYKALKPQEGDPPEIRDQKLNDLRNHILTRGAN